MHFGIGWQDLDRYCCVSFRLRYMEWADKDAWACSLDIGRYVYVWGVPWISLRYKDRAGPFHSSTRTDISFLCLGESLRFASPAIAFTFSIFLSLSQSVLYLKQDARYISILTCIEKSMNAKEKHQSVPKHTSTTRRPNRLPSSLPCYMEWHVQSQSFNMCTINRGFGFSRFSRRWVSHASISNATKPCGLLTPQ
jgi:hypothetical protein